MASLPRPPLRPQVSSGAMCRVNWKLGQALLPEHFYRQELSLRQEWELRFSQFAPLAWGVGWIDWDDAQLARGVAQVTGAMIVFPGGQMLHVDGNASPATFAFGKAAGEVAVDLYAHLLSSYDEQSTEGDVELIVQRLALTTESTHPEAADSLRLARLRQNPSREWVVDASYVPPLLWISSWPTFFADVSRKLDELLSQWQELLHRDVSQQALSAIKVVRAQECLRRSYSYQSFLAAIDAGSALRTLAPETAPSIAVHPYDLFRCLVEFYLDAFAYQTDSRMPPPYVGHVYDHWDIAASIAPLLSELEARTAPPRGRAPYAAFVRDRASMVCALSEEAREARHLYLVMLRNAAVRGTPLGLGFKLTSTSRMNDISVFARRGIEVKVTDRPSSLRDFPAEAEFYRLEPRGEAWESALHDGNVAYREEGPAKGATAYLLWLDD